MEDLVHTGDSANIAYYAEKNRQPGHIWCEVLRNDISSVGGKMTRVDPTFHVRVYRVGTGEIARWSYKPQTRQAPGPLNTKTLTRLVRDKLKEAGL